VGLPVTNEAAEFGVNVVDSRYFHLVKGRDVQDQDTYKHWWTGDKVGQRKAFKLLE